MVIVVGFSLIGLVSVDILDVVSGSVSFLHLYLASDLSEHYELMQVSNNEGEEKVMRELKVKKVTRGQCQSAASNSLFE